MSHRPNAGRPRDPDMESRVHAAACRVYGRTGWAGFTIDKVAQAAGVGKASIYLRWPDKATLLTEALQTEISDSIDADTGSLRSDLVQLAQQHVRMYLGPHRDAALRIIAEGGSIPEVRPRFDALITSQARATRRVVRRGIARGEVDSRVPLDRLLDALFGAILMRAVTTGSTTIAEAELYAEDLVDDLLRAYADEAV